MAIPPGAWRRFRPHLNERKLALLLAFVFVAMSVWVAATPYDPATDLADATTNDIWSDLIREGKYALPLSEWKARGYPPTQSSVISLNGEYYVVNEKGPAHAMLVAALDSFGAGALTGTLCAALALAGTYMLGRRLFNWKVGFLASLLVLTNLTVVVMWHRHLWTDASTMHTLVLGAWLLVEGLHQAGKAAEEWRPSRRWAAAGIGVLGGLCFGLSIATRYPVALVLVPFLLYLFARRAYPRTAGGRSWPRVIGRTAADAAPFVLGLVLVLAPLMQYNATYFGGPLRSGYDATSLMDFTRTGNLTERNQSVQWSSGIGEGAQNVWDNSFILTPVILFMMPLLVLVPFAVVLLWRRPEFWLLVPWAVIVFATYLSLPWVKMYANALNTPWEPRYFMPAIPPLAILAAFSLDDVALSRSPDGRKLFFAVSVTAVLMLAGLVPAENHFKEMRDGMHMTPRGPQGPPAPPGQPPVRPNASGPGDLAFAPVTLAELLSSPAKYAGRFVRVENLTVAEAGLPLVNLTGAGGSLTARLENFTALPPFVQPGRMVHVRGPWTGMDRNGNGRADPGEFILNIKFGTSDRIEGAD